MTGQHRRSSPPGRPATGPAGRPPVRQASAATTTRSTDRAHAPAAPLSAVGTDLHARFVDALDDDLDLPAALVCVREMLRADLPADERRWLVLDADAVLGLDLHLAWQGGPEPVAVPDEVVDLLRERDAARAARDYATADALRDRIGELGWEVVDEPSGSSVRRPG